jgi:antitoxin component HigA of HigAB toxin-antitoxin module
MNAVTMPIDYSMFLNAGEADKPKAVAQAKTLSESLVVLEKLQTLEPSLLHINDDKSYRRVMDLWNRLAAALPEEDENGSWRDDEPSPVLLWLFDILGDRLAEYSHSSELDAMVEGADNTAGILRIIMSQNNLSQSDFPEIGTQGVISELLNGKRDFNMRHINELSARFDIPKRYFLGE